MLTLWAYPRLFIFNTFLFFEFLFVSLSSARVSSLFSFFFLGSFFVTQTCHVKCFFKSLIKSPTIFSSVCNTLLSSTYHTGVHCLPFTVLFSMHISYEFSSKPFPIYVSDYNFYHCRADSVHPYMASNTNIYRTFCPFFYLAFFLCSGLILHIISINVPLNFNKTFLSFVISAWKYAPETTKVATSLS